MPTYRTGDMWSVYDQADLFCITTNASLDSENNLVMGAGIAGQAKEKFPGLPDRFGTMLRENGAYQEDEPYGMLFDEETKIAAFQTKQDWRDDASIKVIAHANVRLFAWLFENEGQEVHLNYPGIGHGNLSKSVVKKLIQHLPDRVHIWQYE